MIDATVAGDTIAAEWLPELLWRSNNRVLI